MLLEGRLRMRSTLPQRCSIHTRSTLHSRRKLKACGVVLSANISPQQKKGDQNRFLYISPVWPEPSSSAAGVRTATLIESLQKAEWQAFYVSASKPNDHAKALESKGCTIIYCPANNEDCLLDAIAASRPDACIFDRFIAEEAFSFRVREMAPNALRVLDLQDLHSLRRGREALFKQNGSWAKLSRHVPMDGDNLLRELASIHRSDLVLVCSCVELQLLTEQYQVSRDKLQLAPFFVNTKALDTAIRKSFHQRQHLMTIGNFRHSPNADSVQWLAEVLWPLMRQHLPRGTQLHCYGAYVTAAMRQLHNPETGFYVKGQAQTLDIMKKYRLCLAPLRFGAGLKGKIVDSWQYGLPVVTTRIGAEGMQGDREDWGGTCEAETAASFVKDAVTLYSSEAKWNVAANAGLKLVEELFDAKRTLPPVVDAIETSLRNLEAMREANLIGRILWLQQNRATEYFSRWIELKESQKI